MTHAEHPAPIRVADEAGLELRALRPADADRIFLVVEANREHLREWLPWVDATQSSKDTRRFLESVESGRRDARTLAYAVKEKREFRGVIGAHDIDHVNRNGKIGYWLTKDSTGRGLMTRATRLMLGILFRHFGLERVEIHCAVGNTASCAVPERIGFRFEGILRHAQLLHGEFVDYRLYSLLREEWMKLAQDVERGL